ncbi:Endonuclease/exonuclease/phosphatase [Cerioporus squamosus]|nr:Endonuclease/exonuclease/phosphatase [Cerioporus squamosus]
MGDRPRRQKKKDKSRARIKIATLNIKGAGVRRAGVPDKWLTVNQIIRDQKIAILAVQEAHLTQEDVVGINALFEATMVVWASADPENAVGARGVAFAVNKRLIAAEDAVAREIRPGRALALDVHWTKGRWLRLLTVYAPNEPAANAEFWKGLKVDLEGQRGPKPDIVLGDFNVVEAPIDRFPPRSDPTAPVNALGDLMASLRMADGLRNEEPETKCFTFLQGGSGSQSRIDRIYIKRELTDLAHEWRTEPPGVPTDHLLMMAEIVNYDAPHMGRGRWMIPASVLASDKFRAEMLDAGLTAQSDLLAMGPRTQKTNPQTIHTRLKERLVREARAIAKREVPELKRRMAAMQKDLATTVNKEGDPSNDEVTHAAILQDKIADLAIQSFGAKRSAVAGRNWVQGETICKYWTRLNVTPLPSTGLMYGWKSQRWSVWVMSSPEMKWRWQ